ncbi:MAG: hypothetical protein R2882_08080 [Gemmatimonadales bacterium]
MADWNHPSPGDRHGTTSDGPHRGSGSALALLVLQLGPTCGLGTTTSPPAPPPPPPPPPPAAGVISIASSASNGTIQQGDSAAITVLVNPGQELHRCRHDHGRERGKWSPPPVNTSTSGATTQTTITFKVAPAAAPGTTNMTIRATGTA